MNSRDAHIEGPDLAALAGLLADGTRANFCLALLDGRAWTANELARHAGVAASTATEHTHLAGAVGAALCVHAFDSGWIKRIGTSRAVALTDVGRHALRGHLGLSDEIHTPLTGVVMLRYRSRPGGSGAGGGVLELRVGCPAARHFANRNIACASNYG